MKLADGREFVTTEAIEGVKYNVYGCPGTPENATRVEHGEDGARVIPGKVAHYLLSMDVDEGVTPFMVTCPDHGLAAESAFYPAGIVMRPSLWPVRMIWRKPTKGERKRELREQGPGGHYASGGLAREWTTDAPRPLPSWMSSGRHG